VHRELGVWALARDAGSQYGNEDSEDNVGEPGDCANSDDNSDRSCACKELKIDGDDGYNGKPSDGDNEPRCCAGDEAGVGALTGNNGGGCMGTFVDHEPG